MSRLPSHPTDDQWRRRESTGIGTCQPIRNTQLPTGDFGRNSGLVLGARPTSPCNSRKRVQTNLDQLSWSAALIMPKRSGSNDSTVCSQEQHLLSSTLPAGAPDFLQKWSSAKWYPNQFLVATLGVSSTSWRSNSCRAEHFLVEHCLEY